MSVIVAACVAVLIMLISGGAHELQLRLERWDYERHCED